MSPGRSLDQGCPLVVGADFFWGCGAGRRVVVSGRGGNGGGVWSGLGGLDRCGRFGWSSRLERAAGRGSFFEGRDSHWVALALKAVRGRASRNAKPVLPRARGWREGGSWGGRSNLRRSWRVPTVISAESPIAPTAAPRCQLRSPKVPTPTPITNAIAPAAHQFRRFT